MPEITQQQSEYLDMMAQSIVEAQTQKPAYAYQPPSLESFNLDEMAAGIVQQTQPTDYMQYLTDTGRYMLPYQTEDGTQRMREDWEKMNEFRLKQNFEEARKKFVFAAGEEAARAELQLLPGMAIFLGKVGVEGIKNMASFGAHGLAP